MKKMIAVLSSLMLVLSLAACGGNTNDTTTTAKSGNDTEKTVYDIGLCNYVDDASLNQIVDNIKSRLEAIGEEKNAEFNIDYENCNADSGVLTQIISQYEADKVDLMIGVATPVAMAMQAATEESKTPVVFSAVSNPDVCGLVESYEAPGSNVTGTSDHLNTKGIFDIMLTINPDIKNVALLYDAGQDSSTVSIQEAKVYCDEKGIAYKEYTGTTVDEVILAAQAIVADKADAVFTPTDNTVMTAELSIYEALADAGIPHYAGADSFALNGGFLGYGVNYADLGIATADLVADILLNEKNPAETPVVTFDNNKATVNTEICEKLGLNFENVKAAIESMCSSVIGTETKEEF